ncbi:MAG: ribonuclease R [Gammaproteobacteria bacterium]
MIWTPESDPAYGAETRKYEKPIPSRAFILQWLTALGKPATAEEMLAGFRLGDDPEQVEGVTRRLQAMERAGQLVCNRRGAYGLPSAMDLIPGRVVGHKDGFGFLVPDEGVGDLFLSARQMRTLLDGDRVLARVIGLDPRGRREGEVVSIIQRTLRTLVGRVVHDGGVEFFQPDNKRIPTVFMVEEHPGVSVKAGEFALAEIVDWPGARVHGRVRLVEVLGDTREAGMETEIAIRSYSIPHRFPEDVEREAAMLAPEPEAGEYHYRLDLRNVPLMTIDGEDARDFDDAVYCEMRDNGGWHLIVAIADVSHYVRPGSALDREAHERGTSVYFPDRVVPMLPEALSNGLCSLNPHVDRFCLACDMTISPEGRITHYRFHEAVMRSHARLTYNKVAAILERPDSRDAAVVRKEIGALEGNLRNLHSLYDALKKAREARGAIDFDTVETKIRFNDQRKIEQIVPVVRNDAHKLIEECMLAANTCTAKLLIRSKTPTLYRNHEGPTPEKLETLTDYLRGLGLSLFGNRKPKGKGALAVEPADYQRVLAQVVGRADANVIQTVMLRSMKQAMYQEENRGHFGLGYDAYTHFTSPIRRYPDLMVHRALRVLIREGKTQGAAQRKGAPVIERAEWLPFNTDEMRTLGEHCSMTERRADEATRDVVQRLKCEYMRQHIGGEFSGVVSAVTGFGLFVNLADIYIEGLIHISTLENDYWHFDAPRHRLNGERSGKVIALGDTLRVKVAAVNVEDRKIDLLLVAGKGAGEPRRSGGREPSAKEKLAQEAARKPHPGAAKRPAGGGSRGEGSRGGEGGVAGKAPGTGAGKPAAERGKRKRR